MKINCVGGKSDYIMWVQNQLHHVYGFLFLFFSCNLRSGKGKTLYFQWPVVIRSQCEYVSFEFPTVFAEHVISNSNCYYPSK